MRDGAFFGLTPRHWRDGPSNWGREIGKLGHAIRLIPPVYTKPFVKRQSEMGPWPRMGLHKRLKRHCGSRIAADHALRCGEERGEPGAGDGLSLPRSAGAPAQAFSERIAALDTKLRTEARQGETTARLQTVPGIGPVGAMAIETFAPPMAHFRCGRDLFAGRPVPRTGRCSRSPWLGLVPRQKSTGGKPRLGKTSKMGQRDIRRLLVTGAMAVVRWAARKGARPGAWLARMLAHKPRMVVAVALANKMARAVWTMLMREEDYRDPVAAVA